MPTITIQMFIGRTRDQKARLACAITDAVAGTLGVDGDLVRITIVEVAKDNVARGGRLADDPATSAG
ncbi:hypothetical protein B7R21_17365 [Subtercola boreus]|uniref:4-oxalocrotonate tautomerase-like domain-containing protein n=1 Tax=Subtercola boreus TaxID=120213 RepID=A0A3E0VB02_9MICO|nr:tautomerase family protein [Subtercola boreus]RFA06994.1 hypothetical protein B7R21_17365 [Subtercola boreus]